MKKILLADDSITIQKVVELTFSDADYQVTCVGNGTQALKKVAEVRPNLVLLDVIMPEKNGYEVCEQIKRNPATAGIPVLLLTGTFEPFDKKRADLAGADGHLTKPFESQVLIAKVEELIARTPTVAEPDAGPMSVISGGDVYHVDPGAAQGEGMRLAAPATPAGAPPGGGAAAMAAEPGAGPGGPAGGSGWTVGDETEREDEGIPRRTHPAMASPDPAAGGSYIGFADIGQAEEIAIVPDRFDEPQAATGETPSTARLRRDDLFPQNRNELSPESVDGAPAGDAGSFTGAFETEFEMPAGDPAPAPGGAEAVWTPPPEAPPAETWQAEPEAPAGTPRPAPAAAARPEPSAGLTPEVIDLIAEKVVQRMSDRVVREIAWEVIPGVAEAIVRRRIRELEEKDPV